MEKLIYAYWGDGASADTLRQRFLKEVQPQLMDLGVERLQLNMADPDLTGAVEHMKLRTGANPKPIGIVSVWLTSVYRRGPAEKLLARSLGRLAGFVVPESTILPNVEQPPKAGERT